MSCLARLGPFTACVIMWALLDGGRLGPALSCMMCMYAHVCCLLPPCGHPVRYRRSRRRPQGFSLWGYSTGGAFVPWQGSLWTPVHPYCIQLRVALRCPYLWVRQSGDIIVGCRGLWPSPWQRAGCSVWYHRWGIGYRRRSGTAPPLGRACHLLQAPPQSRHCTGPALTL